MTCNRTLKPASLIVIVIDNVNQIYVLSLGQIY